MSLANAALFSQRRVDRFLADTSADLPPTQVGSASRLMRHAALLDQIALEVREDWAGLDGRLRDALTAIAYVESDQVPPLRGFLAKLSWAYAFLVDSEGFLAFMAASGRLHEAVLIAIEESNAEFQSELAVALDGLNLDELVGAPLEAGREHEYLASL